MLEIFEAFENRDERTHCTDIKLNPCSGCELRGKCKDEFYLEAGDYCRNKKMRNKMKRVRNDRRIIRGLKENSLVE